MPAWQNNVGENFADELDYKWHNPATGNLQFISLDEAIGKVITSTEVSPYDGAVTIYLKNQNKDVPTTSHPDREISG